MAYKRKTYKRKRTYKKKAKGFGDMTVSQVAQKALQGVNYIRGLVNSELFHYDASNLINGSVSSGGAVQFLTPMPQDDTVAGRTGNSILLKSIYLKGVITWNSSNSGQIIKCWMVQDNQQVAGTAPSFANVFNSRDVISMRNRNTLDRFTILDTKTYQQNESKDSQLIDLYKDFQHHVKWYGTGGGDIQKGGIYLLFVSNKTTDLPFLTLDLRTSYHDN